MYFNSQRQEAISPIYPRSSQRCRGLSAGNKGGNAITDITGLPHVVITVVSITITNLILSLSNCQSEIHDTFLVASWSTTKFVKKNLFFYAKKCTWSTTLLTLTNGHVSQPLWASPKRCAGAGVQVCSCTQIEEISKDHPSYWHSQQGRCVCYDRNRIVWSQSKTKRWTATKRNWTTASFHHLCGNFSKEARQSFLFVNVLIQLGVFLLLLLLHSQLSLVCHREVWLLVHLYTDSAYPLLNLKVLLLPLSICTDTTLTSLQSCRIICCCNAN